jgi:uncharacterized protein (TIGR01619 family)
VDHDWEPYITNVNGKVASILVDLSLHAEIPDSNKPWLLWVWLWLKSPRADGLSDWPELETLSAVEARLTQMLVQKCSGILSGSITTLGRREFYFYGTNPEQLETAVHDTRNVFRAYKFDWGSQEDLNWLQYRDVLFPSDEQMQCIQNRKVLEVLKKNGDLLKDLRGISHWAYFKSTADRKSFKDEVQKLGYRIDSESEDFGDEYPQGICFDKIQSLNPSDVDNAVLELFRLALKFGGSYDGWETQAIGPQS